MSCKFKKCAINLKIVLFIGLGRILEKNFRYKFPYFLTVHVLVNLLHLQVYGQYKKHSGCPLWCSQCFEIRTSAGNILKSMRANMFLTKMFPSLPALGNMTKH